MADTNNTAIFDMVGRVEVFHDHIRIWTLLDTDFDGQFTDLEQLDASQVIRINGLESPAPSLNSLNLFTVGKMFRLFCFISENEDFDG